MVAWAAVFILASLATYFNQLVEANNNKLVGIQKETELSIRLAEDDLLRTLIEFNELKEITKPKSGNDNVDLLRRAKIFFSECGEGYYLQRNSCYVARMFMCIHPFIRISNLNNFILSRSKMFCGSPKRRMFP